MNDWKDRYDIDAKFGGSIIKEFILIGVFIILFAACVVCTATATVGGY